MEILNVQSLMEAEINEESVSGKLLTIKHREDGWRLLSWNDFKKDTAIRYYPMMMSLLR